jgi:CTD small phosphatase-like protein 2
MLVVYTASLQAYADTILDYLDPERTLFSYRLYRNNCLKLKLGEETVYVKDLRIFKNIDFSNSN